MSSSECASASASASASSSPLVVGFLGGGNMSTAIIEGMLARSVVPASSVWVCERNEERCARWRERGLRATRVHAELLAACNVVVIAVKPQALGELLGHLEMPRAHDDARVSSTTVFASILAGVTLATLERSIGLAAPRVVRVMPNTPLMCGAGMSAVCGGTHASADDVARVTRLFACAGEVLHVDAEAQLDAFTGVAGSGPAYVFAMLEGMIDGGVRAGLSRDDATLAACQTVLGAGRLALEQRGAGVTPTTLRERVTSKNGTTYAGLMSMDAARADGDFQQRVAGCVVAAAERSRELARASAAPPSENK